MTPCYTLCAIFAHPDDEAFGVAGTLARYVTQGHRAALICATRGEAGMTNGLAATPADLAGLRTAELACAAEAMGVADLTLLEFADGEGERWDRAALSDAIAGTLRRIRPEVVLTFDREGVTCHPDHITVHEVVTGLIEAQGQALGVRRLFYQVVTCPEQASPEGPSLACTPQAEVDVTVDVSGFELAKRAALGCHRTQAADTTNLLGLPEGSLAAEHYLWGWPDAGRHDLIEAGDLLAGL